MLKNSTKLINSIKNKGLIVTLGLVIRLIFSKISLVLSGLRFFNIFNNIYTNKNYDEFHIRYFTPSRTTLIRAKQAHQKEKITSTWIKEMRNKDGVLWDIGANIGVFSLLAAKYGVRVVSFEPLYSNYYVLCKNVEINSDISKLITVLPIALSDISMVDDLYIPTSDEGYSGVSFGEPIDQFEEFVKTTRYNKNLEYSSKSSILGMSGDEISKLLPGDLASPNYIKIDVDNIEYKIVSGLRNTLKKPELQSVLIEINESTIEKSKVIHNIMNESGFSCSPEDKELTVGSTYNYIFRRK